MLDVWRDAVDGGSSARKRAERQHTNRSVHASTTFGGTVILSGTFDPVTGAEIIAAINDVADLYWNQDQAATKARGSVPSSKP